MTADPLAEVLAAHIYVAGSDGRGCSCGWLRERGDDRSLQEQWSEKHLAPTILDFLAEHFAKPEVVEAVQDAMWSSRPLTPADKARAVLAALLETLGGESNE